LNYDWSGWRSEEVVEGALKGLVRETLAIVGAEWGAASGSGGGDGGGDEPRPGAGWRPETYRFLWAVLDVMMFVLGMKQP